MCTYSKYFPQISSIFHTLSAFLSKYLSISKVLLILFLPLFLLFKIFHFSASAWPMSTPQPLSRAPFSTFLYCFSWFLDTAFFVFLVYSLILFKHVLWQLPKNGYRAGTKFELLHPENVFILSWYLVRSWECIEFLQSCYSFASRENSLSGLPASALASPPIYFQHRAGLNLVKMWVRSGNSST